MQTINCSYLCAFRRGVYLRFSLVVLVEVRCQLGHSCFWSTVERALMVNFSKHSSDDEKLRFQRLIRKLSK